MSEWSYKDGLKQEYAHLDPLAALRSPAEILTGVSPQASSTLQSLGINTVFDLAASQFFALSLEVVRIVDGTGSSSIARVGTIPGGAITTGGPQVPSELAMADISVLRGLDAGTVAQLKQNLKVETVGDLGRWLPFRSARLVLETAAGISDDSVRIADNGAKELVPKLGEFPTERRYYSTIVMDQVTAGATKDLKTAGPIDIAPTANANFGFSAPAVGARLTFMQSWYAHGVTLGNLLHSVALAPGESTRIAVVDWSRRTSASAQESISETEQLVNNTAHNRAISEVQDAVATEVQSGFSRTSSTSTTSEGGGGLGLSLGPLTIGGSASGGSTTTSGESFSSSFGTRHLAASMNQRVMDSTQQAASSARNRRASIVKEVSEQEHESVSTRILANYNHMHALTVQYYEVIEIYRVLVELNQVERCLFIPMKLIDFTDAIIQRYLGVLTAAALDARSREILSTGLGMVRLTPSSSPMRPGRGIFDNIRIIDKLDSVLKAEPDLAISASTEATPSTATLASKAADGAIRPIRASMAAGIKATAAAADLEDNDNGMEWSPDEIQRAVRITSLAVLRPGLSDLFLPREASLESVLLAKGNGSIASISAMFLQLRSGQRVLLNAPSPLLWKPASPVPLQELDRVLISTTSGNGFTGRMTLQLSYRNAWFPVTIPIEVKANATLSEVCRFSGQEAGPELIQHLQSNRLHYSQAIWRSMNSSDVALLLSSYSFEGRPVTDLIDPQPLMVAGNYLVFRMPGFIERPDLPLTDGQDDESAGGIEAKARKAWKSWLKERGLVFGRATMSEQLVPIPTGGVFAEAVLGRSNSAEKLDATRFWNWQDSPIPLQPPEIAAISMESRAQPVDIQPGQLGQPVLNIVNPTSLPDPTGLGSILAALQNGNMFRDMSGLAATIGLAQGTAQNSASAASDAGKLAAANLAVAAQKDIEEKRIAAQLAMAAMGLPAANSGSPKNISETGALINTASEFDKNNPKATQKSNGASGAGGIGGDGGGSSGGSGGSSGGSSSGVMDSSGSPLAREAIMTAIRGRGVEGAKALLAQATPSSGLFGPEGDVLLAFCNNLKKQKARWEQVKNDIVKIANDEHQTTWSNGTHKETEAAMKTVITNYWSQGPYEGTSIPSHITIPGSAWSAAFITWVVKQAGGGDAFSKVDNETTYRTNYRPVAHWRYVAPSKINKDSKSTANPFWAFAIDEVKPEVGDIIVKSRDNSGATYNSFDFKETHGDIVVEVNASNVVGIGGNVSNSVSKSTYPLDSKGFIQSTGGANNDHFAIVRIVTDIFTSPACGVFKDLDTFNV